MDILKLSIYENLNELEVISSIAYISKLSSSELILLDIEILTKNINKLVSTYCLQRELDLISTYKSLLQSNGKVGYLFFTLDHSMKLKINVHEKWMFQIILIYSMTNSNILMRNKDVCLDFIDFLIINILNNIKIDNSFSVHLLKTLEYLVKKYNVNILEKTSLLILQKMIYLGDCPYYNLKSFGAKISKMVLKNLNLVFECPKHYMLLPVTNVETQTFINASLSTEDSIHLVVGIVLQYFRSNIYNKDGANLYNHIICSVSFDKWKKWIWPHFKKHMDSLEEGELCNSFLKHWVPLNISRFGEEFYMFLKEATSNVKIQTAAAFELNKNNPYFLDNIPLFLENTDSNHIALKTICTCGSQSSFPSKESLELFVQFLYRHSYNINENVIKCLRQITSQIFLTGHNSSKQPEPSNIILVYEEFLKSLYEFCIHLLELNSDDSAKIINVVLQIAYGPPKSLSLSYNIKANLYEERQNLFYKKMESQGTWFFGQEDMHLALERAFQTTDGSSIHLTQLLKEFKERKVENLETLLERLAKRECIQNTQKIRNYAILNCSLNLTEILEYVLLSLNKEDSFSDNKKFYRLVLCLEIILSEIEDGHITNEKVNEIVVKGIEVICKILSQKEQYNMDNRKLKVFEAFSVGIMDLMKTSNLNMLNKKEILEDLWSIIKIGNLKKPVSTAAEVLRYLGEQMCDEEDLLIKILFMSKVLDTFYMDNFDGNLKIRRHPEVRLVCSALCSCNSKTCQVFLQWTISTLLVIINDKNLSQVSISSALHTLEMLISDNTLSNLTQPFITEIISSVLKMEHSGWIIRNATLQLQKAIIDRFFGVLLETSSRPKSMENFLLLFPSLAPYFYSILSNSQIHSNDREKFVLIFFIESQNRKHLFQCSFVESFNNIFYKIFVDLIKRTNYDDGNFVTKALSSFCYVEDIPNMFLDVVEFIESSSLPINLIANLLNLLNLLYCRYTTSIINKQNDKIHLGLNKIQSLSYNLRNICNLLSIKLVSNEVILKDLEFFDNSCFLKRIELLNYIPSFLKSNQQFCCDKLDILSNVRLPNFIVSKIYSIFIECFNLKYLNQNSASKIVDFCLKTAFKLGRQNNRYVLKTCFNVIVLLTSHFDIEVGEFLISDDTEDEFSDFYNNIIKAVVFSKRSISNKLLGDILGNFENLVGFDKFQDDIASTIPYIFKYCKQHDMLRILKLIFYLLLKTNTSSDMCYFLSINCKTRISTPLSALSILFNISVLRNFLTSDELIANFLLESYTYVKSLEENIVQSNTYYLIERDICVPATYVRKILMRSIKVFYLECK